jgi:hypothetical protein
VAHNGAMKTKVRCTDYARAKTMPTTGPVLLYNGVDQYGRMRILTHTENPKVLTADTGKKLALYPTPMDPCAYRYAQAGSAGGCQCHGHSHGHSHGGPAPCSCHGHGHSHGHSHGGAASCQCHGSPARMVMMPSQPCMMSAPMPMGLHRPSTAPVHVYHHHRGAPAAWPHHASSTPVRSIFDERRPNSYVRTGVHY